MRLLGLGLAAVTLAVAPSASAASLEIRDAVVRVTVLPEQRSDVVVQIVKTNAKLPLRVTREDDGRVVVDGGPDENSPGGQL